jgi:hypothetical protein
VNRTNIAKDEMDDLVTDSNIILTSWRKHFSQLLTLHGVNDVRQKEKRTAEELVPELSAFEMKIYRISKTTQFTRYLTNAYRTD